MGKHDIKEKVEKKKNKREKKGIPLVLVIMIIVVFVIIGIKFYQVYNKPKTSNPGITLDTNAKEKTEQDNEDDNSSSTGVAIPGWKSITAYSSTDTATVNFINPEANANKFYLTFELILKSTGETLYKSDYVEAGKTISKISLSKHISAGTYDAIVKVQPYRIEDNSTTNNADISVKLIVK